MLFGEQKNFTWANCQKMMNNPNQFIDRLKNYDKNNMPLKVWKQIRPFA